MEDNIQTKYTSDQDTLGRINKYLDGIAVSSYNDDFHNYFKSVKGLYTELQPLIDNHETIEFKNKIKELKTTIEKEHNEYVKLLNNYNNRPQRDKVSFGFRYSGKLPILLEEFNCELRLLLYKYNLLLSKVSNDMQGFV